LVWAWCTVFLSALKTGTATWNPGNSGTLEAAVGLKNPVVDIPYPKPDRHPCRQAVGPEVFQATRRLVSDRLPHKLAFLMPNENMAWI